MPFAKKSKPSPTRSLTEGVLFRGQLTFGRTCASCVTLCYAVFGRFSKQKCEFGRFLLFNQLSYDYAQQTKITPSASQCDQMFKSKVNE